MEPFPPLPVELVREIMETAATHPISMISHGAILVTANMGNDSTATALSLMPVSKTVYNWILPILYHTVILGEPYLLHRTITGATGDRVAANIRNLSLFFHEGSQKPDLDILVRCTRVQRFITCEWWSWDTLGADTAAVESWPQPWEVAMWENSPYTWDALGRLPILRNAPHFMYGEREFHESPESLCEAFPRLTHLGFGCEPTGEDAGASAFTVQHWFAAKPALELIIVHGLKTMEQFDGLDQLPAWMELAAIEDERRFGRPALELYELDEVLGLPLMGEAPGD